MRGAAKWNRMRIFVTVLLTLALYWCFKAHKQTIVFKQYIEGPAEEVWEYVADFSNVKKLNPTILDFGIISESGNYDHWRYSVHYTEKLSQWPHLLNTGRGHYSVKAHNKPGAFIIESEHETCFFGNWYCLNTTSEFHFIPANEEGTYCQEDVHYKCPGLFQSFCKAEVLFQRQAIMSNLAAHFKNNKII